MSTVSRIREHPPKGARIPMMPKGVEHETHKALSFRTYYARIPMMPKGVEHEPGAPRLGDKERREDSNDAERR